MQSSASTQALCCFSLAVPSQLALKGALVAARKERHNLRPSTATSPLSTTSPTSAPLPALPSPSQIASNPELCALLRSRARLSRDPRTVRSACPCCRLDPRAPIP
ncbi:hypothetical protein ZEAMMB73_Zm00001d007401 [Zea mays]|uniref:Uncharacterized protein n=1 Tax=Zea mays TaxID=4577 RepID=A0A1D6F638_MAIZE|nr:hypothetical protein ZEAMMB73_Zm00001d007401 [Zea mays]ONM26726.1 hypothetical protein ZEAMMB73_Zm00001d007401 [Zea mays]